MKLNTITIMKFVQRDVLESLMHCSPKILFEHGKRYVDSCGITLHSDTEVPTGYVRLSHHDHKQNGLVPDALNS